MDGALVRENIRYAQEKRRAEAAARDLREIVKRKNSRIDELEETLRIARRRSAYFEEKNARTYEVVLRRRRDNRPVIALLWSAVGIVALTAIVTVVELWARGWI